MNTRNNVVFSSTELVYIGGIGFMFEVNQSLKHNLISPDVMTFFDGVKESGEVTEDCAFSASIPLTNQRNSIFQNVGEDWLVCYDGIFRKCKMVKCKIVFQGNTYPAIFHVDQSIPANIFAGVIFKWINQLHIILTINYFQLR